jgi:hypothetical protein
MKPKLAVLAVGSFLILASCDAFFATNLFKEAGLGQVKPSDLTAMSSSDLVDSAYFGGGSSASFMEALPYGSTAQAAVLATLETTYNDSSAAPAARQEAAALAVDILVETSGASAIVSNAIPAIVGGLDLPSIDTPAEIIDLIELVVPAELRADAEAFKTAIAALLRADAVLTDPAGVESLIEGGGVSGDYNVGNLAQNAIIAAAVAGVTPVSGTIEDALWAAVTDPANAASFVTSAYAAPDLASGSLLNILLVGAGFDPSKFGY